MKPLPVISTAGEIPDSARLSWPWRSQCHLSIQAGGLRYLPHIRTALANAHESIFIELYMCSSGVLFDEWLLVLANAVNRGVNVRLLLDDIGSRELSHTDRQRISQHGIDVVWFNPVNIWRPVSGLIRDHRKLIIIDNQRAWTGGMGINDRYDPRIFGDEAWLDAMVECTGPVVGDMSALFEQAWQLASRGPVMHPLRWRLQPQPILLGGKRKGRTSWVRVNAARGGGNNPLIRTLVRRILRAKQHVWLCTPYFLPPSSLFKALRMAAQRGVRVQLALAGPETDHPLIRYAGQHLYHPLMEAGVEIHEYQARFMHLKAARVDNWSTLGSFNYDRWNSNWNLEANIEAVDQRFAEAMIGLQERVQHDCRKIDAKDWKKQHLLIRWHRRFWFWFGTRLIRRLRSLKNTLMGRSFAD